MNKSQKFLRKGSINWKANFARCFFRVFSNVFKVGGAYSAKMITPILMGDVGTGLKRSD